MFCLTVLVCSFVRTVPQMFKAGRFKYYAHGVQNDVYAVCTLTYDSCSP